MTAVPGTAGGKPLSRARVQLQREGMWLEDVDLAPYVEALHIVQAEWPKPWSEDHWWKFDRDLAFTPQHPLLALAESQVQRNRRPWKAKSLSFLLLALVNASPFATYWLLLPVLHNEWLCKGLGFLVYCVGFRVCTWEGMRKPSRGFWDSRLEAFRRRERLRNKSPGNDAHDSCSP